MPKIRKETVDEIRRLGREGYTNTEIGERLSVSRSTARKYRVDPGSSLVREDSGKAGLSLDSEITKGLYDMQGVMGASSLVGAVKQAYLGVVSVAKLKVTHWPVYGDDEEEFTVEAMIQRLLSFINYQETTGVENLEALREADAEIERLEEFAEERYEEGLKQGKRDYGIYFRCAGCGGVCLVTPNGDTHRHIIEMLAKDGWGHASCLNRR